MVNNIDSIHEKIWGQCTDPLQNMIKYLGGFTIKYKEKDVIWLLKNLKTFSTGIDSLCNKRVNYFYVIQYFVNMIQGPLEGDDGYTKRARSANETLILAVGRNVLCRPDITEAVDQVKSPEKETTSGEEKFSAIHLLHTSDLVRYGNINKGIQNGSYVGREKYPNNSAEAYELIVRRSGIYQSIGNGGNGRGRGN